MAVWLVFDLGGTLLFDHSHAIWQLQKILSKRGLNYGKNQLHQLLLNTVRRFNQRYSVCERGIIIDDMERLELQIYTMGEVLELDIANISRFTHDLAFKEKLALPIMPEKDIHIILKELSLQYQLGIISNAKPFIRELLSFYSLTPLFSDILLSSDIAVEKPDIKIFNTFCQRNHIAPHEIIYIGNSIAADISPCNQLGIHTILRHNSKTSLCKLQKDYPNLLGIITNISQLKGSLW